MTYDEAITALNDAAYAAIRAAKNEDGALVEALRQIAADVDCMIDHGCTVAELERVNAERAGQKWARFL